MLKKTLMTAVAALAITGGAATLHTPDAAAGVKVHIGLGGYGYGPWAGGYYYDYGCFWKKKRVKKVIWTKWGPKKVWVWKKYRVCY